jgi:hypothetical protein
MSTTETKPNTSAGDGINTEGSGEGAGTGTANAGDAKFTQADVDRILKARLDDERKRLADKAAKDKADADAKAAEDEALRKGELEKVIQAKDARIKDLEPIAARNAVLEGLLHKVADARAEALPEKARARVPAADAAAPEARIEKIEELEAILAEMPHTPPPAGNGRGPKPAGAPDPAKAAEEARVGQSRLYSQF